MRLSPYIFLLFTLFSCGSKGSGPKTLKPPPEKTKVTAAVAANVQFAMEEIEVLFERQTGLNLEVVISSSGKLTAQIQQGAPYDLLLSADMKYPQYLYDNGLAATVPRVYANGTLVLWTTKDVAFERSLPDILKDQKVQKIALANPKNAPYGVEAVKVLSHYNLLGPLRHRLVYGESISQTNQYILSGACELGFTAKSVVLSPAMKNQGRWLAVNPAAYDPIEQGVVITRHGQETNASATQQFYDFLFSTEGQTILERYGYLLPKREN